jgi:hypothetical protein
MKLYEKKRTTRDDTVANLHSLKSDKTDAKNVSLSREFIERFTQIIFR